MLDWGLNTVLILHSCGPGEFGHWKTLLWGPFILQRRMMTWLALESCLISFDYTRPVLSHISCALDFLLVLCSGITTVGAQRNIRCARTRTLVSHVQGKHPTCYTIAPAPAIYVFVEFHTQQCSGFTPGWAQRIICGPGDGTQVGCMQGQYLLYCVSSTERSFILSKVS